MSLVAELRRRNVFRVAAAYLVVGWLLTEVLTTALPTLGAPEWVSRAVILIFVFGFIPAVILSWFYEITPEGIKRDADVDHSHPDRRHVARRLDQATIGVAVALIIVVGLFSARYTTDEPSPADFVAQSASIAVLPFVNMSSDADNEYFSDGLTETLLHMLAQIPDLKVAARTSSFAFKNRNTSIQEIARALEVAHVLEGSVQRDGDRVRVTAQLIRASDESHVWSKVYDRTLDDIFGIQDDIAGRVGTALSASLLGTGAETRLAGVHTTDPDAYDLYLQARKQRSTFSYGGLLAAEDLLKGALLIDPDFHDAKTELATGYLHQVETGLMDMETGYAEVIAITDQVLAVRPDDPVAKANSLFAKAMSLAAQGDQQAIPDLAGRLEEICKSDPESPLQPHILLVRANAMLQRNDESVPLLLQALRDDPFNPVLHYELGVAYVHLKRWDDARAALERSLEIEPAQPNALSFLGTIALQSGDGIGYVTQLLKAIAVDPKDHELPGVLAVFLYQLGLVDEADDFRNRVLALAPTSEIAYQIELHRARGIGDVATSIDAARRAVEDDIEDRRGAFRGAVQHLLRTAVGQGRAAEELEWLGDEAPGLLEIESDQVPAKYRMAQGAIFDAWYVLLPRPEVLRRLDALLEIARSAGFDPTEDPGTHMAVLAIRGETAAAVKVALERVFTRPVTYELNWRETFALPQYADLVADPRVQDALQRWADEEAALRGSVQSYFSDLHASS